MRSLLALVGAIAVFVATPALADRDTPSYTSLVVFGTSLNDSGNVWTMTGGVEPSAAQGYYFGRYSNGLNWTDLLSLALFGTEAKASLQGGTNFSFGGALALNNNPDVPDLDEQLNLYQAYLAGGHSIDPNGLYVLSFGGNDAAAALAAPDPDTAIKLAAIEYAASVMRLNDMGARNILVTGFPIEVVGSGYSDVNALAMAGDAYFNAALTSLELDPDTTLFNFDFINFFQLAATDPAAVGLPTGLDMTSNCIAAGAQGSGCVGYFNFDAVHPTAQIQAALYNQINSQFRLTAVQSVPEPAAWIMMIVGFFAVAGTLRLHSRKLLPIPAE